MNVQKRNKDVSIYCLSSGPTLPEWIGERARRNLSKRDANIQRRIELLQDFQMPSASHKIVQSNDGRYIMVAGTYPPRIKCFDAHDVSMKFERYVNAQVVDMVLLGQDYGKLALLLDDRTVAFHAAYGAHEAVRIPAFGRAMAYEPSTCELLVAAKGSSIYRIHLEEGRFAVPWNFETTSTSSGSTAAADVSATCISVNPAHPLTVVGCSDGMVRLWDVRSSDHLQPFLRLDVQSATAGYGYSDNNSSSSAEITAVAHDDASSGLYMAVGTAGGIVALYDVRSSRPLHIQEHKDGLPIHTVKFHPSSGMVLSADSKLIKAWRYKNNTTSSSSSSLLDRSNHDDMIGSVMVNIEGNGNGNQLTHFIVAGDESDPHGHNSGVLLCAADQPKMESYYVPALGAAPKWCSFLENITEELEERNLERRELQHNSSSAHINDSNDLIREDKETIYENYKFVSRDDVEQLGIANLIGTPLLRGYMHGFFMDTALYNRVRAVANPFEYEDYRKKKIKERLEAKRASRIAPRNNNNSGNDGKNKKAAVNPELAERLLGKSGGTAATTKAGKRAKEVLSDSRFTSLFTNPDYQIDQDDYNFKLRNPSGVSATATYRRKNNMDSDDEDEDDDNDNELDDELGQELNEEVHNPPRTEKAAVGNDDDDDGSDSSNSSSDSDDDVGGFVGGKVRGEAYESMKRKKKKEASSNKQQQRKKLVVATEQTKRKKKVTMYEAEGLGGVGNDGDEATKRARQRLDELKIPLAKRIAKAQQDEADGAVLRVRVVAEGGSKEATFIPRDARRKMEEEEANRRNDDDTQKRGDKGGKRLRRGIKELGFKKPFQHSK